MATASDQPRSRNVQTGQVPGISEDSGGISEANFLRTTALRTAFFTAALRTAFLATASRYATQGTDNDPRLVHRLEAIEARRFSSTSATRPGTSGPQMSKSARGPGEGSRSHGLFRGALPGGGLLRRLLLGSSFRHLSRPSQSPALSTDCHATQMRSGKYIWFVSTQELRTLR